MFKVRDQCTWQTGIGHRLIDARAMKHIKSLEACKTACIWNRNTSCILGFDWFKNFQVGEQCQYGVSDGVTEEKESVHYLCGELGVFGNKQIVILK